MAQNFRLTIITPDSVALEKSVESVTLPAYDGELGILAGHAPTVCRLGAGQVRIRDAAGGRTQLFIDGGVVQVRSGSTTVLTNAAVEPGTIDVPGAKKELEGVLASKSADGPAADRRAAKADRIRARIRTADAAKR